MALLLPLSSNQFASSLTLFLLILLLLVVVARGEEATSSTNNSSTIADDNYPDDDDDYYYNTEEYLRYARTMAYLAKPFALFSMICSYVMIREVIADQRSNCGTPITRTLFSVAVADILFSFASFLGMWPIPISHDDPWLIGNVGNQGWCTFQGFLWILGYLASCFFNASLSVLYLLMVRYYWTNAQLRKLEPWQQGCVWITALAIALYPVPLKLYNSLGDQCGIACTGADECVHVSNDEPHILGATLVPWICLFISLVAMLLLLCTVRSMENRSRKYASTLVPSSDRSQNSGGASSIVNRVIQSIKRSNRSDGSSQTENTECGSVEEEEQRQVNRRKSTAVAVQGICYAIAFLMTYLFDLIVTLWYMISGGYNVVFDHFAYGILMPSAGTFNFVVFARTRTKMKTPEGKFLRFVMCCCCSCCPSWMQRHPLKNSTTLQTSATTKTSSQEAAKTSVISGAALSTYTTEDVHHHSAVDAHHASITENDSALYHAASTELMATEDTDQNKAGAHITVRIEI